MTAARAGSVFRASLAGGRGKGKSTPRDCKDEIEKHSSLERTQVYDRSARGNAGAVAKRIGNEREDGFGRGEEVRREDERTKRDGGTFGKRHRKVEIDGGKITDQKQNSRAITIAHEKVFSLTRELKEKKEINAKMEETNANRKKSTLESESLRRFKNSWNRTWKLNEVYEYARKRKWK